jgi:hypothetical protein
MENEQIPQPPNQLDNFFNITFDTVTRDQIRQAAVWAKVCALCAFVGYGITLVLAFFQRLPTMAGAEGVDFSSFRTRIVLVALLTVIVGGLINYSLYRFATSTIKGMDALDNVNTNEGFNNLRRYFKIYGILLIIVLSFSVLAFLAALLGMGLGQ